MSKPLEETNKLRTQGANRSKETREFEQTARNKLETLSKRREQLKRGANRSKETREFENKEQTKRKRLEN